MASYGCGILRETLSDKLGSEHVKLGVLLHSLQDGIENRVWTSMDESATGAGHQTDFYNVLSRVLEDVRAKVLQCPECLDGQEP